MTTRIVIFIVLVACVLGCTESNQKTTEIRIVTSFQEVVLAAVREAGYTYTQSESGLYEIKSDSETFEIYSELSNILWDSVDRESWMVYEDRQLLVCCKSEVNNAEMLVALYGANIFEDVLLDLETLGQTFWGLMSDANLGFPFRLNITGATLEVTFSDSVSEEEAYNLLTGILDKNGEYGFGRAGEGPVVGFVGQNNLGKAQVYEYLSSLTVVIFQ